MTGSMASNALSLQPALRQLVSQVCIPGGERKALHDNLQKVKKYARIQQARSLAIQFDRIANDHNRNCHQ